MMFDLSPTPSDNELALSPEDNEPQLLGPNAKAKKQKKQSVDLVYVPLDDELDSQEERDITPLPAPAKRKFEAEVSEVKVNTIDNNASPPVKKPKPITAKVSPELTIPNSDAKDPVNQIKIPVTPKPPKVSVVPPSDRTSPSSDESSPSPTNRRKRSTVFEDRNYVDENSDEEDKELDKYTIPDNERATVLFDFDRERDKRLAGAVNIPKNMYTQAEKSLFLQLAMRGFEPLAPKHWQFDFPTLPDSLFPELGKKKSDPIIKISRSTTFYAIKSLGNLFSLSGRVRDCSIVEKRPENLIKQSIKRYIRWALYDGNLDLGPGSVPVHVLHAQRKNESILDALERLNKRLQRLALRHQRALAEASDRESDRDEYPTSTNARKNELPLLIGFIICGPVVAIMTFDIGLMQSEDITDGKFISQFDLSERGQDVWNSLSIAIVVMHIRNTMARLTQNGYGGVVKAARNDATKEDL
ncbi:hypothetical protein BDW59DRAFT_28829 [Aspergillus cavernicola]|uniref:Uncharacterized protein n=1 Tax=Aspergillus cavernicola TaxID=176166 RepID=A0ABR4IQE1_9EURO